MDMQAKIKWIEGMTMLGESGSGHSVVLDGPISLGGKNIGIRPMEMLLLGLGGCTTVDIISILKKMKQDIISIDSNIKATRQDKEPKIFTTIHIDFNLTGNQLNLAKCQKAVDLSQQKYCSAAIMLGQMATITSKVNIII